MFVLERIKAYAATGCTALVNRDEELSFFDLDARSDAFAAWLLDTMGHEPTPVVIYGGKETDFLPCIFGALKAGRAYVPVDVVIPPGRAAEIIATIAPKVVVDFSGRLPATGTVLGQEDLDGIWKAPLKRQVTKDSWVTGESVAYILFTSGSTGKPKGVPITANNLEHFYRGLLPYLPKKEGGVILNQISYSFDVSCCALYGGLSQGMTLFTIDEEMTADTRSLFAYLEQSGLTMWVSTPSFAELCVRSAAFCSGLLPELERFLFCGEVLPHKLCSQLAERFPQAGVLNTYGPTEATVLVTAVWVTKELRRSEKSIPIGLPLDGVTLRLVDEGGNTVEQDEAAGELLILGGSVGPGYHASPESTGKRFFTDKAAGERGYRTGDICYRKNGLYYYRGRADNQLKLHGHRIELEDIENNLARVGNIARAVVVPVWEGETAQYLAAFVLLEQPDGMTGLQRSIQLKKQAAALLPAYMIPRKIVAVDAFPLNTNGKVDKKALGERLKAVGK